MRKIRYLFEGAEVEMDWNEANEALARREAGDDYTVDPPGVEENPKPTQEQRITELEEALALLLSGVTE